MDLCALRMYKYIFKCRLVFICSLVVAGESGCCHEAQLLHPLINMFSSFSLSEEKTQLVLNVDKQLEEVRELVGL